MRFPTNFLREIQNNVRAAKATLNTGVQDVLHGTTTKGELVSKLTTDSGLFDPAWSARITKAISKKVDQEILKVAAKERGGVTGLIAQKPKTAVAAGSAAAVLGWEIAEKDD
ncbi:MAG: hypothetical protein ACT4TC_04940 [Myxococcaceae bacterium]